MVEVINDKGEKVFEGFIKRERKDFGIVEISNGKESRLYRDDWVKEKVMDKKEKTVVILHEDDREKLAGILAFLMTEYETPGAVGFAVAKLANMCLADEERMCLTCHLFLHQNKMEKEFDELMKGEEA